MCLDGGSRERAEVEGQGVRATPRFLRGREVLEAVLRMRSGAGFQALWRRSLPVGITSERKARMAPVIRIARLPRGWCNAESQLIRF